MTLKNFFKPTLAKLLLLLIIPVFFVQAGEIICFACTESNPNCGLCGEPPFQLTSLPVAILSYLNVGIDLNLSSQPILLPLILGTLISYLLSCTIIFLYLRFPNDNKIKKYFSKTEGKLFLWLFFIWLLLHFLFAYFGGIHALYKGYELAEPVLPKLIDTPLILSWIVLSIGWFAGAIIENIVVRFILELTKLAKLNWWGIGLITNIIYLFLVSKFFILLKNKLKR